MSSLMSILEILKGSGAGVSLACLWHFLPDIMVKVIVCLP